MRSWKWAPGLPFLPQPQKPPAASLTFTVTFSRGSGGTSGRQGPPSSACQHRVASAGSEHGASSCQPRGGSSCNRAARQRFRCARGSAGRGPGHCTAHQQVPPALLRPGRTCSLTLLKGADAGPDRIGLQRPHLERKESSAGQFNPASPLLKALGMHSFSPKQSALLGPPYPPSLILRSEIFGEKIPESCKKQNLNLSTGNCLYSI